jgi:hypothetical protein
MSSIQTREHLLDKLGNILYSYFCTASCGRLFSEKVGLCTDEIADLIADLPNMCFHANTIKPKKGGISV